MAGTPSRARAAERACVGIDLDDASSAGAALVALGGDFKPIDDARASAAYRSLVARNLLRRALMELAGAHEPTRLSMAEAAHVG
jgi:xanthine dehydrogenase small subunit